MVVIEILETNILTIHGLNRTLRQISQTLCLKPKKETEKCFLIDILLVDLDSLWEL